MMNVWKNRLLYGIGAGVIILIYNIFVQITGIKTTGGFIGFLSFALVTMVYVVAMVMGIKRYRNDYFEGYITYTQSFVHGFFIHFIAALIVNIEQWIYKSYITDTLNNIKNERIDQFDLFVDKFLQGSFTPEAYDGAIGIIGSFYSPMPQLINVIISATFAALIVAVIVAAFTKKEKPF